MQLTFDTAEAQTQFDQLVAAKGQEQATILVGLERLKQHYRAHFADFCQRLLGYERMLPDHRALCDWMQAHRESPKLVLMPRGAYKSSLCTIGYSLWRLLKDSNLKKTLIINSSRRELRNLLKSLNLFDLMPR